MALAYVLVGYGQSTLRIALTPDGILRAINDEFCEIVERKRKYGERREYIDRKERRAAFN